ncbi:putative duf614 domain-containing protein [Botrytis fragariae]|uniref:Putative duf614 domain-containing protein n=1 Tax=Botrytis fragariae TaxID=1964551 RepID=A0A8H6EPJ9_9HELO|nr:putative duf614 domain-containing protein [Botrytis fragariae]KAF5879749.1 putative duf614 domain-containing protein [Botrytis fragariae]
MPARGNLSYVHDFSDYSATKIVLDHYAKEEKRLQEKEPSVVPLTLGRQRKSSAPFSDDPVVPSTTSSSSSTVRQHTFKEDVVGMPAF